MSEGPDPLTAALADRYVLERELGRGGMATVYLAHDLKHDRVVALKVLHPEHAAGASPTRFLREIRTAARLQHPHIIPVHDSGEAAGHLWYTMPFVEGESLRARLERDGRLALDAVIGLTREVAEALSYAHERGVIHRDIKPENILLSGNHALLADFGIAKAAAAADEGTVTQVGLVLGTPTYMSPEQARGERDVDHRSDIYSLGCVVYELLAGTPPFAAGTAIAVIVKHLTQDPPPLPTRIPIEVQTAVGVALAKEPEQRFASARAFAAALVNPASTRTGTTAAASIAVVDFVNLSGDESVGWLGTGIAETLSIDLQRIGQFKVVGRDRVARALSAGQRVPAYQDETASLGTGVGADWVVTGSFQVAADRVRITPRLVEAGTAEVIAMDKIDGRLSDVFTLQDQVVTRVVEALGGAVPTAATRIAGPPTDTLTAYEHFARGRQLFVQFTRGGFEEARVHYQRAIDADPSYAAAYAGLGSIMAFRYIATARRGDLDEAIRHLEHARKLEPALAEPYLWLAYAYSRSGRFEEAERAAREATMRTPDDPLAHYLLGGARQARAATECRWELNAAAIPSYSRALALQPLYEPTYLNLGWMYVLNGQYAPAERLLVEATRIEETSAGKEVRFIGAPTLLAMLLLREGRLDEAETLLAAALPRYTEEDHLYGPAFTALAWYATGDAACRRGAWGGAIERFGRARMVCQSHPERIGMGYYLVRAHLGLATAFHALRMHQEEGAARSAALDLLRERNGYSFDFVWEGGDGQVCFDLASYHASTENFRDAGEALDRAIQCGWRDLPGLQSTVFDRLRRNATFMTIVARTGRYTELPDPYGPGDRP